MDKTDKTEGLQCFRHSNWISCSFPSPPLDNLSTCVPFRPRGPSADIFIEYDSVPSFSRNAFKSGAWSQPRRQPRDSSVALLVWNRLGAALAIRSRPPPRNHSEGRAAAPALCPQASLAPSRPHHGVGRFHHHFAKSGSLVGQIPPEASLLQGRLRMEGISYVVRKIPLSWISYNFDFFLFKVRWQAVSFLRLNFHYFRCQHHLLQLLSK